MIMNDKKNKLSLDRPAVYEIKVPGDLGEHWVELVGHMKVTIENEGITTTTILSGPLDQAALQGVLRQLYSMGLPLISVICVDFG
jgi:hypothetical protein